MDWTLWVVQSLAYLLHHEQRCQVSHCRPSHQVRRFNPFTLRSSTDLIRHLYPPTEQTHLLPGSAPPFCILSKPVGGAWTRLEQSRVELSDVPGLVLPFLPAVAGCVRDVSMIPRWFVSCVALGCVPFRNIPLRPGVAPLPSLTCLFAFPATPAIWVALMDSTCTLWILCAWDRRGGPEGRREEEWPHPPSWGLGIDWLKMRASTKSAPPSGNEGLVW